MKELTFNDTVSNKTALRDVRLLKAARLIDAKYCREYKSFIPVSPDYDFTSRNPLPPLWPKSPIQRLYMEKIIRLCVIMTEMIMCEVENPIKWYRERYPELSDRTRQRDFAELRKVDYSFTYEPEDEDGPAGYYYSYPEKI